ncbi:Mitochondrial zinc maintenance protein 1, mitochondrial [Staphylotrichum longicolle]|uniref:Mitochondrial zinc maintenance protein 1, mitochondrial n=1 Tax=Staphylotrichum longicolle TaxID=669026 RepID=A0AAD4F2G3_9PEZI|nr:Mitochondrial zinc maintenance protein 1, mitochondrial [Staphylotrichum longicolle]
MAAIQAYRHLLRAARIAFEGDARVLDAARQQIRLGFRDRASLPASDPSIAPAIQHAEEVASFLKTNVVQGKREASTSSTYKLRIHEHTERGDNESIKQGNKNANMDGVKCCSER